ncbi:testis-specific serine/threonine-protein kinase 1-like [Tropilaelaps mercedesae]|uniref:Testis-specific serine/threonine-protein kinase 1-like n=1 Tax=Tropilaelaps mercedesae TaxID=418985 RepID=A0A1V9XNH5_9ACAR|nr:testis-specific serine/threonine-protein kinase 1-like [Tropilaelaps mercedesae]
MRGNTAGTSVKCHRSSSRAPSTPTTNDFLERAGYEVIKKIGGGSYSEVKEVRQGYNRFAVKVIDTTKVSEDFRGRFLPREIQILSKIEHRYIINVHRILQAREKVFIVMELATGGDLLDYVRRKGHLSENRARMLFSQLLEALGYLHNLDIAHRHVDLKCENVLLKSSSYIKLADFGFSRSCSRDGRRVLSQTFCGSTLYASPEVLQGQLYNPKLYDVWSLGCILFIMFFGIVPFDDGNVKKQIKQQLNRQIRFPASPSVAPEAKDLVSSMLEPDILARKSIPRILCHPWLMANKSEGDHIRYSLTISKK